MKNPSDFTIHPWGSVAKAFESEVVARNIMVILSRTGNTFRPLAWDEYVEERQKDGNFTGSERVHFDQVSGYCVSEDTAGLFRPEWAKPEPGMLPGDALFVGDNDDTEEEGK